MQERSSPCVVSPEQLFEEEFTDHVRGETRRQQWRLGTIGASVGATLGGLAVGTATLPAALLAGGAYGIWWARRGGQREKTLDSEEQGGEAGRKGPTMRRLRFLATWGHRQLLESEGTLPEWRALVLDQLVCPFSPWLQQLYLIRARSAFIEDDPDSYNVFMHLLPLYCVLQLQVAVDAVEQAISVLHNSIEASAFDATCVERCCVVFPTILEVISAVDRLEPEMHEDAMTQLQAVEARFALAPREERQPRLSQIVGALRKVLESPSIRQAQSGPVSKKPLALHRIGKAVLAQPRRSTHEQEQALGEQSDDSEFYSCSEDEGGGSPGRRTASGSRAAARSPKNCPFGGASSSSASGSCPMGHDSGRLMTRVPSLDGTVSKELDAKAKQEYVWNLLRNSRVRGETRYPDASAMMHDVQHRDYADLLNKEEEFYAQGHRKVVCSAGGVVAPVQLEWRPFVQERFTGMFRKAEHGLIRCSTVVEPSTPSSWSIYPALVPMVALKFFRDREAPSANLVLAHKKSGHKNPNFLGHAVSNHFTENIVYPFKALLGIFYKYSDFPTFAGCAPFAAMGQDGKQEGKTVAPYAIVLHAPKALRQRSVPQAAQLSKHLIDQFDDLKAGDVLYHVYAVPEPLGAKAAKKHKGVWHVGDLRLQAPFHASDLGDRRLFFQHHLFEGDLALRPDWRPKVDKMVGAPIYEELIEAGDVWDGTGSPPR